MHKNQAFINKKHEKICYSDKTKQKTNIYREKDFKNILPGLEPEKVEKRWSRGQNDNSVSLLFLYICLETNISLHPLNSSCDEVWQRQLERTGDV